MQHDAGQGLRFYGQFDPPVDRLLFERYFRDQPGPGVCLECGAFDGVTESSCKFFEESLGWTAINVEASPRIYPHLTRNRPHSVNLNLALSDANASVEFTDVDHPGHELCTNGSLRHLAGHREMLDEARCGYRSSRVLAVTFRQLLELLPIGRLDLMVLDVEGHELEALSGFRGARLLPRVLCVEHGHLGLDPVRSAVERLGYRFDFASHVNSFFVRDSGRFTAWLRGLMPRPHGVRSR